MEDLHYLANVKKVFKSGNEVTLEWLMNLQGVSRDGLCGSD